MTSSFDLDDFDTGFPAGFCSSGDMVETIEPWEAPIAKGGTSIPIWRLNPLTSEDDENDLVWIGEGELGLVIESQERLYRVLFSTGLFWIDCFFVTPRIQRE